MSRLNISTKEKEQLMLESLYKDIERRMKSNFIESCPVDMQLSILNLCVSQSCGKCVPCRIGLHQLQNLITDVLDNKATESTLKLIEQTAKDIKESADCAIGYNAAEMVLKGFKGFQKDYMSHINYGRCDCKITKAVPCVALCPAGVDIPGYIALVGEGRYSDAIKIIRKDNPFPTACAMVCEHPCETQCRRNIIDSSVNIRGLKRVAVDHIPANQVPIPVSCTATGKSVAIVGGGPSGLTAAYYLSLMGHKVTLYDSNAKLGGMLRYGIPKYRFPRERLQEDIDSILSTGIEVHRGVTVGKDLELKYLKEKFDAIYIAIGAQANKTTKIENDENVKGSSLVPALDFLRGVEEGKAIDLKGKKVVIVGGGNVAMDCTRSAIRLGADKVSIAYRRCREDMTALPEEVDGAVAEGAELIVLNSPSKIETDSEGNIKALIVKPQISSLIDLAGRPRPKDAMAEPVAIPCDLLITAIGQGADTAYFEEFGLETKRGVLKSIDNSLATNITGVFIGGDCVSGPATVIRAIEAGKVAAANIDEYLGFNHTITCDVEIPKAELKDSVPCGRITLKEVEACERKCTFHHIEIGMTDEEAKQEAGRCLRCDQFGYGTIRGGRIKEW